MVEMHAGSGMAQHRATAPIRNCQELGRVLKRRKIRSNCLGGGIAAEGAKIEWRHPVGIRRIGGQAPAPRQLIRQAVLADRDHPHATAAHQIAVQHRFRHALPQICRRLRRQARPGEWPGASHQRFDLFVARDQAEHLRAGAEQVRIGRKFRVVVPDEARHRIPAAALPQANERVDQALVRKFLLRLRQVTPEHLAALDQLVPVALVERQRRPHLPNGVIGWLGVQNTQQMRIGGREVLQADQRPRILQRDITAVRKQL